MINVLLTLLLLAGAFGRSSGPRAPIVASVSVAPAPVEIGGTTHLVYELHLTGSPADVWLRSIEVLAGSQRRLLAQYAGTELATMLNATESESQPLRLARGQHAIVYFWIPLAAGAPVPDSLHHRIRLAAGYADAPVSVVEDGATPVLRTKVQRALAPPLAGGPWVAVYDPGLPRGHRRVLFHNEPGALHIPARFAVDWVRIDEEGRTARDDRNIVNNHYGYGIPVLAVADARVAAARDGVAERKTLVHVAHGSELASGNYVTLDLGEGRYVSYEHLMPGSVRVAAGDRVRRGQVIARLGFSGDGALPHLHMHVSNGNTPMRGEGVPWALEQYEVLGAYPDLAAVFAGRPWLPNDSGHATRILRQQLPAPNVVLRFPTAVSAHLGKVAAVADVAPLTRTSAADVDK